MMMGDETSLVVHYCMSLKWTQPQLICLPLSLSLSRCYDSSIDCICIKPFESQGVLTISNAGFHLRFFVEGRDDPFPRWSTSAISFNFNDATVQCTHGHMTSSSCNSTGAVKCEFRVWFQHTIRVF
jgi:hypothetical protein